MFYISRRKKKCIRYSVDDDNHAPKDMSSEVEDEVLVTPGGMAEASVMLSEPSDQDTPERSKDLPCMLRHAIPVTLQTTT